MKWFSHRGNLNHKADIKLHSTRGHLESFMPWVSKIANTFNREYASIGCMDIDDLTQAGYVGLIEAWNKVDWEKISESNNPDAQLWSFLKIRICLLYTSPSPRDATLSRMPSSA